MVSCCCLFKLIGEKIKYNKIPIVGITIGCKIVDINLCQRIKSLFLNEQQGYLVAPYI